MRSPQMTGGHRLDADDAGDVIGALAGEAVADTETPGNRLAAVRGCGAETIGRAAADESALVVACGAPYWLNSHRPLGGWGGASGRNSVLELRPGHARAAGRQESAVVAQGGHSSGAMCRRTWRDPPRRPPSTFVLDGRAVPAGDRRADHGTAEGAGAGAGAARSPLSG